MTLDPLFREIVRVRPAPLHSGSVRAAREQLALAVSRLPPGPAVARVRDLALPVRYGAPVGLRVYDPFDASGGPAATVVFLHGGGWVLGDLAGSDPVCRALAAGSGCRVVSVDYRLAPEHPFPCAADDAYAALEFAAAELAPGRPLVVCGDSAGGNLAAVAARRARDRGGPAVAYQALVYPVTDCDPRRPSYREHGTGLLMEAADMAWFWDHYLPDPARRLDPDASPLRAPDLGGLPPALLLIAAYDPLRDECAAYAEALRAAGVPVRVLRYDTVGHGFFRMLGTLPQSDAAVREVAAAIGRAVTPSRPLRPSGPGAAS